MTAAQTRVVIPSFFSQSCRSILPHRMATNQVQSEANLPKIDRIECQKMGTVSPCQSLPNRQSIIGIVINYPSRFSSSSYTAQLPPPSSPLYGWHGLCDSIRVSPLHPSRSQKLHSFDPSRAPVFQLCVLAMRSSLPSHSLLLNTPERISSISRTNGSAPTSSRAGTGRLRTTRPMAASTMWTKQKR